MTIGTIDTKGISATYKGKFIMFEFITNPQTKILNEVKDILLKEKQISYLKEEISYNQISEQLQISSTKELIIQVQNKFTTICGSVPNTFWDRKQHIVTFPYKEDFKEKDILTRARPRHMNQEYLAYAKEITSLLDKNLINKSYSPWSCTTFNVNNAAEIERGLPSLVINYKPLIRC